jgi:hypothetical protein
MSAPTERNIVFIIGAGASAAICPDKIPCMGDYFEKWMKKLEAEKKTEYWLPLACLEEARVFPPNPEAEQWATRVRTIEWEIYTFKDKKLPTDQLEETQRMYIESYTSVFKKDTGRTQANLEKILTFLEQIKGDDAEASQARLIMSINTFFNTFDQDTDTAEKFSHGPHQQLAEFLQGRPDLNVTFISFNYDLWLEKAFQRNGLWNPARGYGHEFLYSAPHRVAKKTGAWGHYDAKRFENPSPSAVTVLKPNGSLSWFFSGREKEVVVLTHNGQEDGEVTYNPEFYLDRVDTPGGVGRMLAPLIVPPIPTPNRRYPVFWSIDKKIQECLNRADVLVITGWSLPDTDQKFAEDFRRAINSRASQLPSLILCDTALKQYDSRSQLIRKFEALSRPEASAITRKQDEEDGFSANFVQFLAHVLAA